MMAAGGGLARCSGQVPRGVRRALVGSHRFGGTVWMEPRCRLTSFGIALAFGGGEITKRSHTRHAAPVAPSARHASSALRRLSREGRLRPMKVTHERRGSAWMVKGPSWHRRLELQPAVPQPLSLSLAPKRRGLSSRAQTEGGRAALRTRVGLWTPLERWWVAACAAASHAILTMRLGVRPRWPFDKLVRALHRLQRVHPLGASHLEQALRTVQLGHHQHCRTLTRVAAACVAAACVAAARRVAACRASPRPRAEQQLLVCELLRLEEDGGHRLAGK